ncbi:uncharacterized protein LOC122010716 [Zingiber officinale]|uniref:uncharacterized protein LOC122010716 n=1 Tax=Zingiber officinale TaxID=94328 RepID=UPI001C4AEB42|nr:uncharacterized protein LOC122010716 [Zingiber officinale]
MSIVLRFVDSNGFIQERFFGLVHVSDTAALTLKDAIYSALVYYNLDIQNIRGQGYDGASNMRDEFNGLQALIIKDFNIVGSSCKRNDELKNAHADDIAYLIGINELETGCGLNQIGILQRAIDTRWSSHLRSLKGLIKMFSASCTVLLKIMDDGLPSQRVDATTVYDEMTSFDFVFILHLMKEIMGITDILCQTLQSKSQDIINAMELVLSTKHLLQQMRDNKWDDLLVKVKSFCELRNIDIPDFNAPYINKRGRGRAHQDNFTIEHHYRIDLFYASIDSQLQEVNGRFSDDAMELLTLINGDILSFDDLLVDIRLDGLLLSL